MSEGRSECSACKGGLVCVGGPDCARGNESLTQSRARRAESMPIHLIEERDPRDMLAPPTRGEARPPRKNAPEVLEASAAVYRERNALYGDNYKFFGHIMYGMFPHGLVAKTVEDFNRLGIIVQCAGKLSRYAQNFERGGHFDSALDLATYAAMLHELTDDNAP